MGLSAQTAENSAEIGLDLTNPPQLTDQRKAGLEAPKIMPDGDIDYNDIPLLSDEFWKNAIRHLASFKIQLTL
jgi:hypothetical protein